jgi:2-iminobutanoate/2-iminopropanoate deaminase
MIVRFHRVSVCLLFVAACGACLSAQTPAFKVIQPAGYKAADSASSPGLLANGTLYVSGQGSQNPDGARPKEFAGQVGQALRNVQVVLHGAGMDFGNVVWMNIYLTDTHDVAAMDEVYWRVIGPSPPARTVLTVAALPDGEKIEINCIAVADTSQRKAIWPEGWPRGPPRGSPCDPGG